MHAPWLLGIEIGGTKLQVGLGRADGNLVDLERLAVVPANGAAGIRAQVEAATTRLLDRHALAAADLLAVGVGFGGPVEGAGGVVLKSHQVAGWDDFPLADWVRAALGVPRVALANDADAAALGEARLGAGVGFDPVLYATIGSGIGGGLIVGGRIYRGAGRGAVEIGHLAIGGEGDDRDGGPNVEDVASGWAIGRAGRDQIAAGSLESASRLARLCAGRADRVTGAMVAQAAIEGDPACLAILARAQGALGQALAQAITLLAPARVILGGGVSLLGEEHWFGPIRREVARRVFPPFGDQFAIVPAALGEAVVVHGALLLAGDAAGKEP